MADRSLLRNLHLVLVLDAGMSLSIWEQYGLLTRETALYRRLLPHLGAITLISHGDSADLRLAHSLTGIHVKCNRWQLSRRWYQWSIVLGLGMRLRLSSMRTVVKTNQMPGAGFPARLAKVGGAKFLVRTGYRHADFVARQHGRSSFRQQEAIVLEQRAYAAADCAITTTPEDARAICADYGLSERMVNVIPNFVDTTLFSPNRQQPPLARRIALVGRLAPQKNPLAAIEALQGLDVVLVVVGEGPLQDEMRQLTARLGVKAEFLGRRRHEELPGILNSCDLYLQPSLYEGHPKSLLEAMACGLPIVAGDSPGIRGVIVDGETGLLCAHDVAAIRSAVLSLLDNFDLRCRLGEKARAWAESHVSLDRIAESEMNVLAKLLA